MKFSLFFEMQLTDPSPQEEIAVFYNCVEQAKLADELGYHCIWEVEHHGLYEYSHSSAPEVFLAFVAGCTKRIRIGHGCTLLPFRYNHPIRVAERVATLDILSNGRVNWGTAKSVTRVEKEAFEVDASTIQAQWRSALEMVPKMWVSDVFSHQDEFFNIPPICVIPKPLQKPHPPIFAACSSPDQAAAIGRLGVGALNLAIYHDEFLADRVRAYRNAIAESRPVGSFVTNHFACNPATLVLKDDLQACRVGLRGARFFSEAMLHYSGPNRPVGKTSAHRQAPTERDVDSFRRFRNGTRSQLSTIIGDPVVARESVARFAATGVDELILVMQMGTIPHDQVMESIRTFGEQVMPHFG